MERYCDEIGPCRECPLGTSEYEECDFSKWDDEDIDDCFDVLKEAAANKTKKPSTASADNVNHPKHYELPNGIECFDVLLATQGKEATQAFCICNAIKYLFRHKRKNGVEDVKKAKWYIDKYIELEG